MRSLLGAIMIGAVAACSLDESGLLGGADAIAPSDGSMSDVHDDGGGGVVDNYVPPVCSTLDASCT